MNRQTSCTLALIATALLLTGCGPKQSYYWGDYEKSVYRMYHDEDFSPSKEIDLLNGQIERANKKKLVREQCRLVRQQANIVHQQEILLANKISCW